MLSVERVKELLGDSAISDKEAEEIRDHLRLLAEVVFERWSAERRADPENHPPPK